MTEQPFDEFEPQESEWEEGTSPYDDEDESESEPFGAAQDVPFGEDEEEDSDQPLGPVAMISAGRTGREVIEWVKRITEWHPRGMCQQFTRVSFGVRAYYGSAADAWHGADYRHPTSSSKDIPPAVPVFWLGGSRGYGHAAVSLGNGLCRSTDWPRAESVGTARIDDITRAWGQRFVGWTEDINEVRVYTPPKIPVIDASNIAKQTRKKGGTATHARRLKKAVAAEVGRGKMKIRSDSLGGAFKTQYKKVQRKYLRATGQRVTERAADGIPGKGSLTWLGKRHGFKVKP